MFALTEQKHLEIGFGKIIFLSITEAFTMTR